MSPLETAALGESEQVVRVLRLRAEARAFQWWADLIGIILAEAEHGLTDAELARLTALEDGGDGEVPA